MRAVQSKHSQCNHRTIENIQRRKDSVSFGMICGSVKCVRTEINLGLDNASYPPVGKLDCSVYSPKEKGDVMRLRRHTCRIRGQTNLMKRHVVVKRSVKLMVLSRLSMPDKCVRTSILEGRKERSLLQRQKNSAAQIAYAVIVADNRYVSTYVTSQQRGGKKRTHLKRDTSEHDMAALNKELRTGSDSWVGYLTLVGSSPDPAATAATPPPTAWMTRETTSCGQWGIVRPGYFLNGI